jgi:hypothetical protein
MWKMYVTEFVLLLDQDFVTCFTIPKKILYTSKSLFFRIRFSFRMILILRVMLPVFNTRAFL